MNKRTVFSDVNGAHPVSGLGHTCCLKMEFPYAFMQRVPFFRPLRDPYLFSGMGSL